MKKINNCLKKIKLNYKMTTLNKNKIYPKIFNFIKTIYKKCQRILKNIKQK